MKVNWKVRFKNKVFLVGFFSLIISFIYAMLELFDIAPVVGEGRAIELIHQLLTVLGLMGVIVDPTTEGVGDSERALGYEEPWQDEKHLDDDILDVM